MKKNPKNQGSTPQKEDSIAKRNDELQEDELNKVTGGSMRKAGGNSGSSLNGEVLRVISVR
jgi:bacteriocin-like protein